jgi:hypothetical protein
MPYKWTYEVWREMNAYSRSIVTREDSEMLFVVTFGNPCLYHFVLQTRAPFWDYARRVCNLVEIWSQFKGMNIWLWFVVELVCILQDLLLVSIESRLEEGSV